MGKLPPSEKVGKRVISVEHLLLLAALVVGGFIGAMVGYRMGSRAGVQYAFDNAMAATRMALRMAAEYHGDMPDCPCEACELISEIVRTRKL